nr:ABC transporter ATP-binding protein [Maliibacterium massiliense]
MMRSHGRAVSDGNKPKDLKGTFKRLFGYMSPYKKGLIAMVVCVVVSTIFTSLGPYILGLSTDTIAKTVTENMPVAEAFARFIRILVLLAAVYLLSSAFKYLAMYLMAGVSERTMYDLRHAVDAKLKRLPLNYFDSHAYGDVLSRVTNDVDTVANSLQQSVDQLISAVVSIVCIFTMMLIVSPILTLIGLVTIPITLFISMRIIKRSQKYFRGQQRALGDINGYVEEMYNGHNVIAAFGREESVIQGFEAANAVLYNNAWKAQFASSIIMPMTQALTNVGYVAVAVTSGFLVIGGRLSIGMIQSFIQYLRQFSQPITQVAQIANVLQSTAAAGERIFQFLDESEEPQENPQPQFPAQIKGDVTFDHVRFGYSSDRVLIQDLNLHVPAGDKVAIVGPTGAGKTTLVNLLLRFYDVSGGAIRIDGVDIRDMTREKLRSLFGMVLQDTWLFTGTIADNIRYGKLDATDEEVVAAAKAAHCHSFIKTLPGGYNMMLEEGATNLAQGQRQLLTIARAILADCPILILDEATSSVDTRTEVRIQKAMNNLMRGRTSFVIAHRLSTIKDSEMILYMQDGDIKETGNHKTLLARGGYYAKLYNSQFAENNARA